jgi:hypothetical protein
MPEPGTATKPMIHTCPACKALRAPKQYLCEGCWFTLQPGTRSALTRSDNRAAWRLIELNRQLHDDVPLDKIQVTT